MRTQTEPLDADTQTAATVRTTDRPTRRYYVDDDDDLGFDDEIRRVILHQKFLQKLENKEENRICEPHARRKAHTAKYTRMEKVVVMDKRDTREDEGGVGVGDTTIYRSYDNDDNAL